MPFPEWGDVPSAFAAVGTVGAFTVSLWLLRQQQQTERRHYAEQIGAWLYYVDLNDDNSDDYPSLDVRVRNNAPVPVYDVQVQTAVGVRGTFVRYLGSMGPLETRQIHIFIPGFPHMNDIVPELLFSDPKGQRWHRDARGRLRPVQPKKPVRFEQDPGAYEDHPTLNLGQDGPDRGRGIVIDE